MDGTFLLLNMTFTLTFDIYQGHVTVIMTSSKAENRLHMKPILQGSQKLKLAPNFA